MSVTTISLIESLLQHDRPAAWWGLDTADPLTDDSGHGFALTALATPTNATSLHTRGDTGASGCRDFNGTTGGYFCNGRVTDAPAGPPAFHDATSAIATSATGAVVSPGGVAVGDEMFFVAQHMTQTATVTTAPSGWTIVNTLLNATTHALVVYKKTAVEADTLPQEYRIFWNSSAPLITAILVYRGWDTSVAGCVFDSNRQVTASATFHSTTTETHPAGARQLVIWTKDVATTLIDPNPTNENERLNVVNGNAQMVVVDYAQETAGSGFTTATTGAATTLGAFLITFGAPNVVLEDALDAIAETLTIGCLVNLDTVSGTDTIIRKHQSWGLHLVAGVLTFLYRDGGGVDRTVSGPTLTTGVTYRLWVKDDGTNIHFFVNGTKTSAARTGTAGYTTNANRVSIAHYNDTSTNANFLDGRIDELAVFAAPLSDQQIMAHEIAATQGTFGDFIQSDKTGRFPRAKLEIAWASNPTDRCHVFENVTSDLRTVAGFSIQSCTRSFELDRFQAGTMSFGLDNRKRRYDDTYTSSPYYPNVKPTRPTRFRMQVATDGPVIPGFFGETEGHPLTRPAGGLDAIAMFTVSDMFSALALDKVRESLVRETEFPGARIEAVLDDVPGIESSIEEGKHLMIGDELLGLGRLEHCQSISESDGGVLYADARGRIVYQDGHHRPLLEQTVRATYTDENSPESVFKFKYMAPETDQSRLFTAAAVTPASGTVQRSVDDAKVLEHRERTKELTVLLASDNDALAMANHYARRYSTARSRVPGLLLQPASAISVGTVQAYWNAVLSHDISHRIRTVERPMIEGVPISSWTAVTRDHFIEGISMDIRPDDWTVSLSVSPAELDAAAFVIDTTQIGDTDELIGW